MGKTIKMKGVEWEGNPFIDSGKVQPNFVFDKEITIEEAAEVYTEFSDHDFIKALIRFDGYGNGYVLKKREKTK
jgi:threonine dehydrogenase-like Zn-dependent dehydrogenase